MSQKTIEPIDPKDLEFVKKAQDEEKKYKKKIPEEFYERFMWCSTQVDAEVNEAEKIILDKAIPRHVTSMYTILRKAEIPADSARSITVWRFAKFRSLKHILRYIPEEAKDQKMVELARKKNAKTAAIKEKIMVEAINKEIKRRGLPHDIAVEAGRKGGENNLLKNGLEHFKYIGSQGGRGESIEEAATKAVKIAMIETGYDDMNNDRITLQLHRDGKWARKIRELWEGPLACAYVKVNKDGTILAVDNLDQPLPNPQQKKLEIIAPIQ